MERPEPSRATRGRGRACVAEPPRMRPIAGPAARRFQAGLGPGGTLVGRSDAGGGVGSSGTMSVGGSDRNEDFHQQLRLQELYERKEEEEEEGGDEPFTYTDSADGTQYEWDRDKKAWFPKVTEDFLATYHANYGFPTEGSNTSASAAKTDSKAAADSKAPKAQPRVEAKSSQPLPTDPKQKGEKRKADAGWFHVEEQKNTNVYVTGLPPDITKDEFVEVMSKCGIVMRDLQTEEPKIKLYKDKEGNLKGDGLCCYLKRESVELALKLLDEKEIRGYKLHVEVAQFQLKGEYDASKKKKKCKDYKKKLSQQQKLLDWRPEKKEGSVRLRHERVIIIRNMFHPKDFEEDPLVLNEIREDLRTECEKFGQVKKVIIFDRHPDGVASVSFKESEEADVCKQALNGRWFGGRQLSVETWDGVTDYQVEETSREREERLKGWQEFLGDPNQERPKKPPDANSSESGPQAAKRDPPSQDNGATEATEGGGGGGGGGDRHKGAGEDVTASTDSSAAGSDEEAET
ncbi:HIV Tat-specific factor 1 [Pseudonaja textilis]|uniref:17S U2 SnRNP complex component HTATSF1 n=1 Tax=Pseudonaja textilis TaxID=8673 RepID=A0A670Z8A1_PSETE|nr:HIV Tat-specific factor 1 [Pseudonaja textilis]